MRQLRLGLNSRRMIASLLLAVCGVWMGAQRTSAAAGGQTASEKTIDAPFTLAVKTPHVAWARPWAQ